ncbi:MAG TPA: hypothetical protein VGO11_09285 [Chthoniobacteraceae bacterium]|jgi:hypothetical protein|nr:hypothetical protein [Chthoniobacteraceae bacterium]
MKTLLLSLAGALLASTTLQAVSNDEVAARKVAYEIAGAFTNEGFKMRDGCWSGKIELKKAQIIQVNLYAGNQYWFSLGATGAAKKLSVSIYDETGKPLAFEPFTDEGKAAAGFAPAASGSYYIKVEELEGAPATFCLLYSYK